MRKARFVVAIVSRISASLARELPGEDIFLNGKKKKKNTIHDACVVEECNNVSPEIFLAESELFVFVVSRHCSCNGAC